MFGSDSFKGFQERMSYRAETLPALPVNFNPNKNGSKRLFLIFFYFSLSKKIRLDVSCESSA